MRRKIAVGVGLLFVAFIGLVVLGSQMTPPPPPLWIGMTEEEAFTTLDLPFSPEPEEPILPDAPIQDGTIGIETIRLSCTSIQIDKEPDAFGWSRRVTVHFDNCHRLTAWEVEPRPYARPPWLDTPMKGVGL